MTDNKITTDISQKLSQLQKQYYAQLPDKVTSIESAWKSFKLESKDKNLILNELYRYAYGLLGSAATFDLAPLSRAAKQLQQYLKLITDKDQNISQEQCDVIERSIQDIKQQAETVASSANQHISSALEWEDLFCAKRNSNNLVYVVGDDELLIHRIVSELEISGFNVETFCGVDDFIMVCDKQMPAIIIMDVISSTAADAGVQAIKDLKDKYSVIPSVIFISGQTNIDTRLAAVRAGAVRYFHKPLDFQKLRATVEGLSSREAIVPYRVLIVDDSPIVSEYYATILNQAAIDVRTVNNPLAVLDVLDDFHPDLILLDLYMPECDGIELVSMIRQDDSYANSSIAFLSSEIDTELKLKAIDIGVDDFISKPIEPNQLISFVTSRVKRTRGLNNIRSELQSSLRDNEFQRIALDSHSIVSIADASGNISYINNKFCEVSGYSRKELIGQNHRIVKSGEHAKEFYDDMWKTISSGKVWSGEIKNRKKNGDFYWVESTIVPFLDVKGIPYQYISIRTDITPIMKIQEDLFDAKERAENASRAKTEFLSNMSHELRTPLNAILGFSQIMLQDELSDAHRESLGEIQNAGNHLLHLINEVLDLARIESDKLTISMEPVVLHDVVTECVSLIAPLAERKSIQVDFSEQKNIDYLVHADNLRLKQVIINLLSNAIKYNHANGHLKLYYKRNNNALRVYIEDDGIGMTESEVSELFRPFHRLVEHSYGAEGTGIGLFISKKLLDLMGGKIGVKSAKGKGSVFWIELDLEAVAEEEVQEELGMIDSNVIQESQKKYTVLYVEDNPVNMLLIDKIVKRTSDFELIKAFTPEEGIELAKNNKIDLFLLDINLPGMTGFELLQHFRAQQATKDVKAVALSANAMETDIQHGINAGFVDYITKPIVVDQFIDKLRTILECE